MSRDSESPKESRDKTKEELRYRTKGLSLLLDISKTLVSTLDTKNVLQATIDGATELVGLDTAAIYLLDGDMLHLRATTPPLDPEFPDELRVAPLADHPHIGKAISSGEPLFVWDIKEAGLTTAERQVMEQRNLRTILYIPLIADVEAIGAFIVGSVGKPSLISDAEIDMSCTLANLAALAIENTLLYGSVQRNTVQLERTLAECKRAEEEREDLQAQLIQSQKLESIGRLAGGIAHDFNNMLSVILGHSELGLMKADQSNSLYKNLKEIHSAAQRSANLTQQLLGFARKQTITPQVLDLNKTVESLLTMLRRLISEDIELDWVPGNNMWPVKVDPVQIDQILVNLCINASDSITDSGEVTIETGTAAFDEADCADQPVIVPGEYAVLSVTDDGCGMDSETLHNVFEPFFTTKELGRGTGLGLATVYGIVKQNRGFITVSSEPDNGSTFKIYLPRHMERTEHIVIAREKAAEIHDHETVLFVEDEPALLNLGKDMLEMLGCAVIAADSPSEAIRLAREHTGTIHLLMTDVIMPDMNGRELIGKLKTLYPDLKCLYMSGYSSNIIAHHGVLDEGVHYIQKPFSLHDLADKIRQTLGG